MDLFGEINLTGLASVILFYLLILGVTIIMMMMLGQCCVSTMLIYFYHGSDLKVGMWAAQKKSDVEGISEEVENN